MWTGEFDLNTLRVDGQTFQSGKKNLRIQNYPDTCRRGLACIIYRESCGTRGCNLRKQISTLWTFYENGWKYAHITFKVSTKYNLVFHY